MAVRLEPSVDHRDPIPDPDARFELLGVLICAHSFVSDEAVIASLPHYLEDARATMSNSVTLEREAGKVIAIADIRSGGTLAQPRVTILGTEISDTLAVALRGRPLSDLIAISWLQHSGLVIREVEVERGDRPMVRVSIETTRLDIGQAVAAVADTAHLRVRDDNEG